MTEQSAKRIWPVGGYAPGGYTCQCRDCKTDFVGDKRASQCLECAITSLRSRISELERGWDDLPPDTRHAAIAAAWSAWHERHGGKLGPGPAFSEAIAAAIRAPQDKGERG